MKKILSFILSALIIILVYPRQTAQCAEKPDYEYTIINNEATITGFKGEPAYINIPETIDGCRVTELRDNAFYECPTLRHIDIPETVVKIGHHCFYGCTSLESVTLPESAIDIGMGCFCGCTGLKSAAISSATQKLPESCFRACTSLTNFTVPDSIETIGDFCFSGCTSLKEVSIGSGVTSIGDCAFYMCNAMDSLYIPSSVKTIGICAAGYVPTDDGAAPQKDFTVLGDRNSEAKKYARDNNLSFTNAADSVHAFAIQSINGQRRPITIPSVLIFSLVIIAMIVIFSKVRRRILLKAKNNKNFSN